VDIYKMKKIKHFSKVCDWIRHVRSVRQALLHIVNIKMAKKLEKNENNMKHIYIFFQKCETNSIVLLKCSNSIFRFKQERLL